MNDHEDVDDGEARRDEARRGEVRRYETRQDEARTMPRTRARARTRTMMRPRAGARREEESDGELGRVKGEMRVSTNNTNPAPRMWESESQMATRWVSE